MKHLRSRSLFYKMILIVICSFSIAISLVMFLTMQHMQNSFTSLYSSETKLLLEQISDNYYELHKEVTSTLELCRKNPYIHKYLANHNESVQEQSSTIYNMEKALRHINLLNDQTLSTLMLFGVNGQVYVSNNDKRVMDLEEIWNLPTMQQALRSPNETHYVYINQRLVNSGAKEESITAIRILQDEKDVTYGAAMMIINLNDFEQYYRKILDPEINTVAIIDKNGFIFSSNEASMSGKQNISLLQTIEDNRKSTTFKRDGRTIMVEYMPFLDSYIVCWIDDAQFFAEASQQSMLLMLAFVLILITCLVLYALLHSAFKPLEKMRLEMENIREGDFEGHLEVKGEGEIAQLAQSYNYMLDGLKNYIDELMSMEKEKRLLEIHALQMQINPHFMYNTLMSFKILAWQNKNEELIQSLTAFISLLHETLGNKEEKITVNQEIKNLENYVQILKIRFGTHISVHYNIDPDCLSCVCPKLILQPFVENAFFHAFTDTDTGNIDVFGRVFQDHLLFEIIDNGKGMDLRKNTMKGSSFSGVGISNVQERIVLLYGKQYGVHIESMPGNGTFVTIELPVIRESNA